MIRKLTKSWSLVTKFLCTMIIILAIPIIFLGVTSYIRSSKLLERQVNELIIQIGDEINNDIDTIVMDYDYLLIRMLSKPEIFDFLQTDPENYLSRLDFSERFETSIATDFFLKNPYSLDIEILGKNGITYSSAGTYVRESYAFYDNILPQDGSLSIFHLTQGDRNIISLSRRIFSGNQCLGIMILNIKTQELNFIWDMVDLRGGEIFIIDDDNSIIYQSEGPDAYKDISSILAEDILEKEETFSADIRGVPSLCVIRPSKSTNWKMLICLDKNTTLMPINSFRNYLFVSALMMLLFAAFTAYFFIRLILSPLNHLKDNMKEVGSGNWMEFKTIETRDEIGELMRGYNRMVAEIKNLIKQIKENEKNQYMDCILRQKAEIQALQSQINPHFLYNTLGTINAYAMADSKENVQKIVDSLSKMFRYATHSPLQSVKVIDEQNHVKDYLTIQSLRLIHMPEVIWNMEGYTEWPMLRLTLQPLVENCFKHGFKDGVTKDSKITIRAWTEDDFFIISVEDNGDGPDKPLNNEKIYEEGKDSSIGLSNVNRRIMIAYGEKYGVSISGAPNKGAVCNLKMPLPFVRKEE